MKVVGGKLFVGYLRDAHSELAVFSSDGKPQGEIPLPELGTVSDFDGKPDQREAFFEFSSFTTPPTVFRLDLTIGPGNPESLQVWSRLDAPIDPSRFESQQVFYDSKDGTRIPMFIIRKKGVGRDGIAPGLLYGYGGFNIALTPSFRASFFPWLESGGVLAIANLRGGSEYGEECTGPACWTKNKTSLTTLSPPRNIWSSSSTSIPRGSPFMGAATGACLWGRR